MNADLQGLEPDVLRAVEEVARLGPRAAAAFDADGTVWAGDIGEDLLRELALHRRLLHAPPGDPYARYEHLFHSDPARAFAYCVEVMKGLAIADVERWSDELYRARFEARVFPGVRAVLARLRAAGVQIWVVSASNAVTLRRAALGLGLEPEKVLAVEGAVDEAGRYRGEVLGPVTCGAGKVEALRAHLRAPPEIAFGNSLLDLEMLEHARRAVVVAPQGQEGAAVGLARSRGWPVHRVEP